MGFYSDGEAYKRNFEISYLRRQNSCLEIYENLLATSKDREVRQKVCSLEEFVEFGHFEVHQDPL